jgi:uncharacterized membrane protein YvbJ
MGFCKECGNKLKEGALFCKECGTPVDGTKEEIQQIKVPTQKVTPPPKKPMSKKTKIWMGLCVAAAVLLFSGYKGGEALTSETRLIKKFETALIESDAEAVAEMLSSNDKKLEITEENVKGLLQLYKGHPDQIRKDIEILEKQAKFLDSDEDMRDSLDGFSGRGMVNLEQDGKFLFYDKYEIDIEPVYLELGTNYKDTVLLVDEKEVGKADHPNFKATFGPFVPGYHKIEGKLKTDFLELAAEEEVLFDDSGRIEQEFIELKADEVTVSLPDDMEGNVRLLINGKDVGVSLTENSTFGPVLTDGSMKLSVEADLPWGKVITDEVPIEDKTVEVNLINEKLITEVTETIHQYWTEYNTAFTTLDDSKLTTVTDGRKQVIMEDAKKTKDYKYGVKLQYVSSKFDLDSTRTELHGSDWYVRILTETTFNRFKGIDEEPQLKEFIEQSFVYLKYDPSQKKWLVDFDKSTSGNHLANAKELVPEESKVYTADWTKESAETEEVSTVSASGDLFTNSGNVPDYLVELTEGYAKGLVDAVNNNDFSLVEPYLLKDSNLYKMQKDLVKSLAADGVKETYVSFDIYDYWSEGGEAVVFTNEKVKITYGDGSTETKKFKWKYLGGIDGNANMKFAGILEAK